MGARHKSVRCVWLALLAACGGADAEPRARAPAPPPFPLLARHAPDAATEPAPARPPPAQPQQTARSARRCEVELKLRVEPRRDGSIRVVAFVRNLTDYLVQLSFPDRCPLGPVRFDGLGAGYDYYQACNKGACAGFRPALVRVLAPHAREQLDSVELDPRGGSCTPPLTVGGHQLVAALPGATPAVCSSAPVSIRVGPVPGAPAPAAQREDAYRCERPDDCVLSCPEARGCCGHACGCRHAIHRDHRAAYEASYARTCQKQPCPAVGCAYRPAAIASCRDGRCVAVDDFAF